RATTAAGLVAVPAASCTACKPGYGVMAADAVTGAIYSARRRGQTRYGVEVDFVDTSDIEQLKKALKPNTRVVYLETPANPNLKITDIELAAKTVHDFNRDIMVICDNTFATPYLQNPIELGCDAVVHSATKYLNGHGDVIAGFVAG